jgi:hypothetical protein
MRSRPTSPASWLFFLVLPKPNQETTSPGTCQTRSPGVAAELRAVITERDSLFKVRAAWPTAAVCGFSFFIFFNFLFLK